MIKCDKMACLPKSFTISDNTPYHRDAYTSYTTQKIKAKRRRKKISCQKIVNKE
jgi:hypothetical protein